MFTSGIVPNKPAHSFPRSSDNDYGAVMMVVVVMVTVMTVVRLRISGSRKEGDESK
jgi:hypothetical protein